MRSGLRALVYGYRFLLSQVIEPQVGRHARTLTFVLLRGVVTLPQCIEQSAGGSHVGCAETLGKSTKYRRKDLPPLGAPSLAPVKASTAKSDA